MEQKKTRDQMTRQLAFDGLLTTLLVVLGMIKLPSLIPGAEFQLSAPYAVCLAVTVGFQRYLGIGICASVIQLALGTHTVWNVVIAMVFRLVAGLLVTLFGNRRGAVILAGPAGTAAARLVLAWLIHTPFQPLLMSAVPGMIFTAAAVGVLMPLLNRVMERYHV